MSDLPIKVCVRCGVMSQCVLWHGQWIAPEHLGHDELAKEYERLRAELAAYKASADPYGKWQRPTYETNHADPDERIERD